MPRWNLDLGKSPTGARIHTNRKKMKRDRGYDFIETTIGAPRIQSRQQRGGHIRTVLMSTEQAMVADPKTGKSKMTKILTVVQNPANANYARRNVITKQASIKTEAGLARVTNSPAKDGHVNAVLVDEKK